MKKSEKLLDAIGQIEDRYVEEAALAGKQPEDIRMAGRNTDCCDGSAPPKTGVQEQRIKKSGKKKTAAFRWQGALAACAVLAVCISVFALLQKSGVLLSPFEGKSGAPEMAAEDSAMEAAPEAALSSAPQSRMASDISEEIIAVKAVEYRAGTVTFTLENKNADTVITYGRAYYLEQLTEGIWQEVLPQKEAVWKAAGYALKAGEPAEETVQIDSLYGELPAGEYRLVKDCSVEKDGSAQDYPFYVEFSVVE